MNESSRHLTLTPQEAFLAVKCLTDAARMAWMRADTQLLPEDTPDRALRERFDLALLTLGQKEECDIAVTLRDCWTLSLWLEVAAQVGPLPVGILLRNKVTQLRLEFEARESYPPGGEATGQEPSLTAAEVAARLKEAQPWVKRPRSSRGRFRKRARGTA